MNSNPTSTVRAVAGAAPRVTPRGSGLRPGEWAAMLGVSALVLAASCLGSHSRAVGEIAHRGRCDLYLLTGDEIPFAQDGLRDGEPIRHEMHRWFEEALAAQPVTWRLLRGSPGTRLQEAAALTRSLFAGSTWLPAPASLDA